MTGFVEKLDGETDYLHRILGSAAVGSLGLHNVRLELNSSAYSHESETYERKTRDAVRSQVDVILSVKEELLAVASTLPDKQNEGKPLSERIEALLNDIPRGLDPDPDPRKLVINGPQRKLEDSIASYNALNALYNIVMHHEELANIEVRVPQKGLTL